MKQRILGILLCLLAVLGISTAVAFADVTTGDGYTYDSAGGKLTITSDAGLTAWNGVIDEENIKVLVIGSNVGEDKISATTFRQCEYIENIVFEGDITLEPCTITITGDINTRIDPFEQLPYLKSVTFKGKATLTNAFSKCSLLETVTFGSDATLTDSFGDCNKLTSVTFKGTANLTDSFECDYNNDPQLATVIFESTSKITGYSFYDCLNIEKLTFKGKATLEGRAFYISSEANTSLTDLIFPEGSTFMAGTFFGFNKYTGLESVTFKGDVTLGYASFGGCTALKALTFEGTSALGEYAFWGCTNLSSLVFKKQAIIGGGAFGECGELTSLVLPAGSTLGTYAFTGCEKLEAVTFAGDITLTSDIFPNCTVLKSFFFNAEAPTDKTFKACTFKSFEPTAVSIYVPKGAESAYQEALNKDTNPSGEDKSNSEFVGCVTPHTHTWANSKCTECNIVCEHPNFNGYKCSVCDYVKPGGSGSGSSHGSSSSVQKPTVTTPDNGAVALSPDGKTAIITPDDGYEVTSVKVNDEEKGAITEITGLKTGDKVEVTFAKTKATLDKEAKEIATKLAPLSARSSKTAKGNVKVVAKLTKDVKAAITELENLGYTVKYKFYRSMKKSSSYKAKKLGTATTYYNTRGKSGTRYYYKVQLHVYDKDGNFIAKTALKSCKYATRIFG